VLVAGLSSSVTSFVGDHGLYAVFVLMAVDAVFPAASELVMVYAGALAAGAFASAHVTLCGSRIETPFWGFLALALAGTLGYLVGSLAGWGIGAYGGRPLLERRGRLFHLSPENLARAERWFDRWGDWAVFLGRITPVVRSFVSIPAGVFRVGLGRYTVLTLAGSALWCFTLAAAGWGFGASYDRFDHGFRYAEIAIVAGVLALAAYLVLRRRRTSTLSDRASDPPS
jgi:membrane protein DedA with SNARE-associated domain